MKAIENCTIKQTHYLRDILFAVIVCGSILAGVWWTTRHSDAQAYVEDHSATEHMIELLQPNIATDLKAQIARAVDVECKAQGMERLKPVLVAMMKVESVDYNPRAVSFVGINECSYGLMQINPDHKAHRYLLYKYSLTQLMEPATNIREGIRIFKAYLQQSGGNVDRALVLYNGKKSKPEYRARIKDYALKIYMEV